MINEELVGKSVDVAVRITNLTLTQILKGLEAISKGLENKPSAMSQEAKISKESQTTKEPKPTKYGKTPKESELKHGKQTLKQLHKHNEGLSTIELKNPNLRQLHNSMKKADIDFSAMKDGKGKYTLFFKGKNADEMTHAFKNYTGKMVDIAEKKSIKLDLKISKSLAQEFNRLDKEKHKKQRSRIKVKSKGARDR